MALTNKLNITDSTALARTEEKLSKQKALLLFESGYLNTLRAGTFNSLARIHRYLFEEIYDFAGEIRTVNLSREYFVTVQAGLRAHRAGRVKRGGCGHPPPSQSDFHGADAVTDNM